jgi:hypothetical protein
MPVFFTIYRSMTSPSVAALLLRVVVLNLKGLCAPIENDSIQNKSYNLADIFARVSTASFNDEHVRRAITWAEALLDAHFSAMALNASYHGPTIHALTCVMETVGTAGDAAQEVEKVLGVWTHIRRVIESGGEHVAPSTSLYQQEQLQF